MDKIGQLFMVGFEGTSPSLQIENLIKDYGIGGVILFAKNIEDPLQLKRLCYELQAISMEANRQPLLIAIDQEGGVVNRIENGVTVLPGAMAIGATGSEDFAYEAGKITALELSNLGINFSCNQKNVVFKTLNPKS